MLLLSLVCCSPKLARPGYADLFNNTVEAIEGRMLHKTVAPTAQRALSLGLRCDSCLNSIRSFGVWLSYTARALEPSASLRRHRRRPRHEPARRRTQSRTAMRGCTRARVRCVRMPGTCETGIFVLNCGTRTGTLSVYMYFEYCSCNPVSVSHRQFCMIRSSESEFSRNRNCSIEFYRAFVYSFDICPDYRLNHVSRIAVLCNFDFSRLYKQAPKFIESRVY